MIESPAIYLDIEDISPDGKVNDVDFALVFFYADFCGYCKKAVPDLLEFARKHRDIPVIVIQGDCKTKDKAVADKLTKLVNLKGYPHYCLMQNGFLVDKPISGRSVSDLERFVGIA